jgi:hypothetical protein
LNFFKTNLKKLIIFLFITKIYIKRHLTIMATKFPKFSQALAQDPATRRIWYGIATAHDLEAHDGMTEENLYQKIFASHFGHLAVIFLWTAGNYSMLLGKVTLKNG